MYTDIYLPGLVDLPDVTEPISSAKHEIEVPETYKQALGQLVLLQKQGVTHFMGGPLHLEDGQSAWLSPVEVTSEVGYSYFQLLYVNTTPLEAIGNRKLPVTVLEIDEAGYKLTSPDHPSYTQLMGQFDQSTPHIIARHCESGMAYFPHSVTPGHSEKSIRRELKHVLKTIGFAMPEVILSVRKPFDDDREPVSTNILQTYHAKRYTFNEEDIFSYGMILENDPWKYYEVLTARPIEELNNENVLLRVDSGCDIGQIFDDRGCDCREQLHTALTDIQNEENGMIIHIPSQDGRGFGAATKMETEGIKRGIEVVTNHDFLREYDTITAAQLLLGDTFDIRTYDGAGRILKMLGIDSVILQTDNRLKTEGLVKGGLGVTRKNTQTTAARGAGHHVAAKHQHNAIYYSHDEE